MPPEDALARATLTVLRDWFLAGTLTPTDYLEFCLARISTLNPKINAVLELYEDSARAAAKASTERYASKNSKSDIDGMPIGIKANIAVRGHVCHGGIKAYEGNIASYDADIVHRLRRAGAIIIGSLNMEEGALGAQTDNPWFGKTYNPIKDGYTPGGSSGGSAAAVACGMIPASLGTDTMGSVRIPSAYCGLVGFKPSKGTYSTDGVMPLSTTLDTVGTHTRTVSDAVMIYKAVTGFKGNLEARPPRHMAPFDMSESDVSDDIRSAFNRALTASGVQLNPSVLSGYDYGAQRRAGLIVSEVEGAKFHACVDYKNSNGFSETFKSMLSYGAKQSPDKIKAARRAVHGASDLADSLFKDNAALVSPTAPQTAFQFGDPVPVNQADFTALSNFADLPAISLRMGVDGDGLPMGFHMMTRSGRDRALLGMALYFEGKI